MSDKILYVGQAKARDTNFGQIVRLSLRVSDVALLQTHLNDKGYVNVNISPRKAKGKYGETHTAAIDTWVPDPSKAK